jgi:uncharacterized membrane protein YphA (DoxX/SURF4 family)
MSITRHAPTAARVLLGLVFFVFGLNGFLNFLPAPPPSGPAGAFGTALAATGYMWPLIKGYMWPLIKGTELVGGALLLSNRFVPLALALLAPVIVNIVAFHTALAPPNPVTFLVLGLELYLAWSYRDAFRPMLAARAVPTKSEATASATKPVRAAA